MNDREQPTSAPEPAGVPWQPAGSGQRPRGGPWRGRVGGRAVALFVDGSAWRPRYDVVVDEVSVATKITSDHRFSIRYPDGRVDVRCGSFGGVRRATAHVAGVALDLDAPPGSKAERLQQLARNNPSAYAVRHVLTGVGSVLWFVLGAALVARFLAWLRSLVDVDLPTLPLPDWDLPRIPWPNIDLPDIPWPDWTAPPWLAAVLDTRHYWWPILLGVLLAAWEVRRHRRQARIRSEQAAIRSEQAAIRSDQARVPSEQENGPG